MDIDEKRAVLKLAGYEMRRNEIRAAKEGFYSWNWVLDNKSPPYFCETEADAIENAWDHMTSQNKE